MKCKPPIQRLLFNMVEVVIALVIVMVALIGIMGMIPHGIEANYNAMTRSSAADAADQFLHYMASRVEQDWVETEAFPDAKNADASSGLIFSDNPLLENDRLLIQFEAANAESEWLDEDSGIAEMINNKGIFKIAQRTAANTTDFTGEIRAWRTLYEVGPGGSEADETKNPGQTKKDEAAEGEGEGDDRWRNGKKVIMAHYPPGQDGKTCHTLSISETAFDAHIKNHSNDHIGPCVQDLDGDGNLSIRAQICTIYAEVSWPLEVPYEKRQKVVFQVEVAKPMSVIPPDDTVTGTTGGEEGEEGGEGGEEGGTELFTVEDGQVILGVDANATVKVVGCALDAAGTTEEITASIGVAGSTKTPFGSDPKTDSLVGSTASETYSGLAAGDTIDIKGMSWYKVTGKYEPVLAKSSTPTNQNVSVLKNGQSLPASFDYASIPAFLSAHVDAASKTVKLSDSQVLFLFELETVNLGDATADFNDLCMIVTITAK